MNEHKQISRLVFDTIFLKQNSPLLRCYELISVCLPGSNNLLKSRSTSSFKSSELEIVSNSLFLSRKKIDEQYKEDEVTE